MPKIVFLVFILVCWSGSIFARQRQTPVEMPWALVNGTTVTAEEVKQAAADDLELLELKRVQAILQLQREEYQIYQQSLETVVEETIIRMEATKRGITPERLLSSEVDAKLVAPTVPEVEAFWRENGSQTGLSENDGVPKAREYLLQERRKSAYRAFIEALRGEYTIEKLLDPLRVHVNSEGFPSKGPENAIITIVEFADFQCPFCAELFKTLREVEKNYSQTVRIVYRQFPLPNVHPDALKAAEAALCAFDQQRFWELHDAMFEDNRYIDVVSLKAKASGLELDTAMFNDCVDSGKNAARIREDVLEATKLGVAATPTLFINGRYLTGARPYEEIANVINEELSIARSGLGSRNLQ